MYRRLFKSRLRFLSSGKWVSVVGQKHPVRVETVHLPAEEFDAEVFEPGRSKTERFTFKQITEVHSRGEGKAMDKIIANSRAGLPV